MLAPSKAEQATTSGRPDDTQHSEAAALGSAPIAGQSGRPDCARATDTRDGFLFGAKSSGRPDRIANAEARLSVGAVTRKDRVNYLCETHDGLASHHYESRDANFSITRFLDEPSLDRVQFCATKSGFGLHAGLTSDEAIAIGIALVRAGEELQALEGEKAAERMYDEGMQQWREMEDDLVREAEARGEEYIPTAITSDHMNAIEMAVLHGDQLKPWQEELKPSGQLWHYEHDGGHFYLATADQAAAHWYRWKGPAHPLLHVWVVTHRGLDYATNNSAATDDFGTLVMVPEDSHALLDAGPGVDFPFAFAGEGYPCAA